MKSLGIVFGCLATVIVAAIILMATVYESERTINDKAVACVGVTEESFRDSTYNYEVSTRNIIVGVVLSETVVVPVYVVLKDFYCPVAKS